jgi:hypothetical protein
VQGRGSARFQRPRNGPTIRNILDTNINNNPASCPEVMLTVCP